MKFKVLGVGCKKCNQLYSEVEKAIEQTGVDAELEKVEKLDEIMRYPVMQMPALIIEGKVVSSGKVASANDVAEWITRRQRDEA